VRQSYVTYLPELEAEHEYWMDGSTVLRGGQGYRRVVRLSDGTILNRYWDDRAEPRDESYREDIATEVQTVRRKLLMTGGVATTLVVSGQQWDHPNGWAPLQWIAVVGLKNYNEAQLAAAIAKRWSCEIIDGYQTSRILVEKYNLMTGSAGGGGEYAVQVGFGWTNCVLRALASLYPTLSRFSPQLCVASRAASQ
jgi:neutral trehalase